MNKSVLLLLGCYVLIFLSSCNDSGITDSVEYLPFQSEKDGRWGMIASSGEVLFDPEFTKCPSVVRNGCFIVENSKGKYEIYTAEKKPKQIGDEYKNICEFYEDVTPAAKYNEVVKLIDRKGKIVATLDKINGKEVWVVSGFSNGIAIVGVIEDGEKTFGCINKKGTLVIDAKYVSLDFAGDGKLIAIENRFKNEKNPRIDILDTSGKILFSYKKDKYYKLGKYDSEPVFTFCEGLAPYEKDEYGGCGLINDRGNVVLRPNPKIAEIVEFSDDKFIYKDDNGSYGIKNIRGEDVIRAKYDYLFWASKETLWATQNGMSKLIDLNDNYISEEEYPTENVGGFRFINGYAFVPLSREGDDYGIINESGEEVKINTNICGLGNSKYNAYSHWVNTLSSYSCENDYIDFDKLVDAAKITKEGVGWWNLNMSPEECMETGNQLNNELEIRYPLPEEYDNMSLYPKPNISYDKNVMDVKMTFFFEPSNCIPESSNYYISDNGDTCYYSTTEYSPFYVGVSFRGKKLIGKQTLLYNKLFEKIKPLGKIFKEGEGWAIIVVDGKRYYTLFNINSKVCLIYSKGMPSTYEYDEMRFVELNRSYLNEDAIGKDDY